MLHATTTLALWESTLTEEQKEQLSAGTLAIPANVSTPGDGSFVRQWWYNQQSAEDQALIDAGELEYPERYQAANFVDTFALGEDTRINLLSNGTAQFGDRLEVRGVGESTLRLTNTNGAANNKTILFKCEDSGSTLKVQAINDAGAGSGNTFTFERTGNLIDSFNANVNGNPWLSINNTDKTLVSENWTINADGTSNIKTSDTLTVKDFGAKGDGSDDTDAINAALDWWVAEPYRHLHFPEGTYVYSGDKTLDFNHQYGNKLTMDGCIKATKTSGTVFTFQRISDASVQMFANEGGEPYNQDAPNWWTGRYPDFPFPWDGLRGDYLQSHGNDGVTFLRMEAAHNTKVDIHSVTYRGRVVHMTDYDRFRNDPTNNTDRSDGGNKCIFCDLHVTGKGRKEGRVGQQFFWDSGSNAYRGATGSVTWVGDGYWYGGVIEKCLDVYIPYAEAGSFVLSSALDLRGSGGVHIGTLYLGETIDSSVSVGQPGFEFSDCMLSDTLARSENVLLNVRPTLDGSVLSTDVYIDQFIALQGGVGLNVEKLFRDYTGLHINQMRVAGCGVGININDVYGDIYIGALSSDKSGMLFNKYGVITPDGATPDGLIDINVIKMGQIVYRDKPAIRSFYHHGLLKITGNFDDHLLGMASNQPIIEITDDGADDPDDYVLINNALFYTGTDSTISTAPAIKINNSSNKVRVTDCIFKPNTTPFGGTSFPSYVRGCVGAADTP